MNRLRTWFAAAAALVVGGAGITAALLDTAPQQDPPMTCREARRLFDHAQAGYDLTHWFVTIQDGTPVPRSAGEHLLGDCSAGTCTVSLPAGCDGPSIEYTYQVSQSLSGWRVGRVRGHKYFAEGWETAAAGNAGIAYLDTDWRTLGQKCVARFTVSECQSMLGDLFECWIEESSGDLCRYGHRYGPGMGGDQACAPGAGWRPYPCAEIGGPGWAEGVAGND